MNGPEVALHNVARVGLAGALLAVTATAAANPNDIYALVGARVLSISGAPQERATVLLRDGLIEAVGPDVVAPAGARVIDVQGLTITPGLIDAFGGVGLPAPPARRSAADDSTTAPRPTLDPLAPQAFALERVRVARALEARDKGVTTALVIGREGLLPGRSVLLNLAGDEPADLVWRQPAALHVHMAPLASRYPNSLMGVVALVRQALYDAERYERAWADYERAPRGQRRPRWSPALEAWQQVRARRLPLVVTAPRENDVRRALALRDEFDLRVIVAAANQASRLTDVILARKLPVILGVNFDPPRVDSSPDEEATQREIAEAQAAPAALARAGVRFAFGSAYAPDFLAGVRKAIEKGLPRASALRALTLDAAQVLGIADRTGSLEAGKAANVVVWQGEPLSAEAKVKYVFVDGMLFEPDAKPAPKPAAPAAVGEEDEPQQAGTEERP